MDHVRLTHADNLFFLLQPSMDVIKTEPNSDSETYSSPPINEDLISVKLEELPLAVINTEANVSYISLSSSR
jgi:hypothetical protein